VSSAILYLAIIAIWAGVLVPRWVHKPHRRMSAARAQAAAAAQAAADAAAQGQEFSRVPVSAPAGAHETNIGSVPGAGGGWTAPEWAEPAEGTPPPPAAGSDAGQGRDPFQATADGFWAAGERFPAGAAAETGDATPAGDPAEPGQVVRQSIAWQRLTVRSSSREADDADGADEGRPGDPAGPDYSRAHVLQSRRRLLTMLVTLMAASLACTVTGLSPWWVLAPSGGMLGMYLLLLREAANADAERAQWLAQEHAAYLETARLQAGEAREAREAWEASQPRPTAEIIDISDRVGDQLYDQYADAAIRAVGD
jgi:hypothetical protein